MKIKDVTRIILFLAFAWFLVCALRPYWDKYWLGEDMRVAAIYGTKHSVEATKRRLTEELKEDRRGFSGDDFTIDKDERNTVTIGIRYIDAIRFFGLRVKELEFSIEKRVTEVEAMF